MPTTPVYALPWPLGSELVKDGDDVIRALAERVEALLAQRDVQPGFRNVLRNGDMGIAQRGITFTPTPTSGVPFLDGWTCHKVGGTVNGFRDVAPLTAGMGLDGAGYMATVQIIGQAAAGDFCVFQQSVEGVRTLAGEQVTLSFLAYASAGTPKVGIEMEQVFGTGGSPSAAVTSNNQAITLSTTPTRYIVTFTIPSIAGKTLGSTGNDRLAVNLWLSSGSGTYAARASNIGIQNAIFYFTDIQLEAGPVATPFERLPQQMQLAWCQRYFWRWSCPSGQPLAIGMFWTAGSPYFIVKLPQPMRAVPTVTLPPPGNVTAYGNTVAAAFSALTAANLTNEQVEISGAAGSVGIAGGGALIRGTGGLVPNFDFSAEL